jgi:hypothetical protein
MKRIQVSLNSVKSNGTLHEDRCAILTAPRRILLRMRRNISDKICLKIQNIHFVFSSLFFEMCRYEMKWKKYCRADQTTDDRQYGARNFRAGYIRLQAHTQNMQYTLFFHGKNGYANASGCYVMLNRVFFKHTSCLSCTHTHTHTHTRTQTRTNTHTHTNTRARKHTNTHTCTQTHKHTHKHAHTQTHS